MGRGGRRGVGEAEEGGVHGVGINNDAAEKGKDEKEIACEDEDENRKDEEAEAKFPGRRRG